MKRYETYKIDGRNIKKTPQGFLEIPAYTARTGVQSYKKKDGTMLKEFRPEVEVFAEKNIDALKVSPVTNGHPPEMVTPKNSKKYMVGFPTKTVEKVEDEVFGEKYLKTWLVITDQDAINAINSGKAQISNGYTVNLDFSPGFHKGYKYDAIQRDITNNHIAIVWNARGGPNVRLKMDAEDAEFFEIEDEKEKIDEEVIDWSLPKPQVTAGGALSLLGLGEFLRRKWKDQKQEMAMYKNALRVLELEGGIKSKRNDFGITAGSVGTAALLASLGVEIFASNQKEKEIKKIQQTLKRIERSRVGRRRRRRRRRR